jgi:hypothetical protein
MVAESLRDHRTRRAAVAAAAIMALLGGVALYGCATTIVQPADVRDPVSVYIIDYGYHSGLVLPRSEATFVEYTYGEWWWFALGHNQPWDVVRALFVPTQGTLGRRVLDRPLSDPAAWWEDLAFDELFELVVERERAQALLDRLEARWFANADERVYDAGHDMDFVHDPMRYHLFNNCNPVLARWVEELGCEVRGWALLSNWIVRAE